MPENACLIIGCGKIAATHAQYLQQKVPLYFYSRDPQKAQLFNERYKGAGVLHTWEEVLARQEIKNWIICSPLKVHFAQLMDAIAQDKVILCEKPLCATREELSDIGNALQSSQAHLMVAENYCYRPLLAEIQQLLEENLIGDIQEVVVRKEFTQKSFDWRRDYGALLEGGIHFVAMLNSIVRSEVKELRAEIKGPASQERSSRVKIDYQNGVRAQILYSWETPSWTKGIFQHSRIKGSLGEIIFESNGLYLYLRAESRKLIFTKFSDFNGRSAMLDDFLQLTRNNDHRPRYSFKDVERDMGIIFNAYEQCTKE